jgi:hypothetical protein
LFDEMAQSIIKIVFGGELQKGLAHLFARLDDLTT